MGKKKRKEVCFEDDKEIVQRRLYLESKDMNSSYDSVSDEVWTLYKNIYETLIYNISNSIGQVRSFML